MFLHDFMILLEFRFFGTKIFAVVQTSPSPTQPGGEPPLIAREAETRKTGRSGHGGRLDMVTRHEHSNFFLPLPCHSAGKD